MLNQIPLRSSCCSDVKRRNNSILNFAKTFVPFKRSNVMRKSRNSLDFLKVCSFQIDILIFHRAGCKREFHTVPVRIHTKEQRIMKYKAEVELFRVFFDESGSRRLLVTELYLLC